MARFTVGQARAQFSRLLRMVEKGEPVIITRNGRPVAELAPIGRLILGASKHDATVNHEAVGGNWWRAMTDKEAEGFLDGA